ncbi:MAG TPA: hypothetical protein VLZ81_16835, partial [Blastocatellia bacterium]|nr:hypothetical protein [Blastocatellia bacterium]
MIHLDANASEFLPEIVIFDPANGTTALYRFVQGGYTLQRLPGAALPANSAVLLSQLTPEGFSNTGIYEGSNQTTDNHISLMISLSNGVRAIAAYDTSNVSDPNDFFCPSGLSTWTVTSGVVSQSLSVA